MYTGLIICFLLLIFSVVKNIFIGYTLTACWILFVIISFKKGHRLNKIMKMSYDGAKKSFVVLKVFILIGAVVGIWMASGTIPAIVYYCLKYITPSTFVLCTFIICCITSFLIGTSLGTVSVVGIPLMILARSGNMNLNIVAGAIIAGAYFGDRCSPMSSSAALIANLTETDIFINIKNMFYSSIIPFLLSLIFYYILSVSHPLRIVNNNLSGELLKIFNIQLIMILPAVIILVLSLCKVEIDISILISILCAAVLSIFIQKHQLKDVVYYIIFGFKINYTSPLQSIIKGGGVVSMLKASFVIFVSCSIAGIFEGIKIFDKFKKLLLNMNLTGNRLFGITTIVSIATAAFGCNQSISTVMTSEIMKDCYNKADNYEFALHLENSGILIAALIPWNIAALVPTTTMNVSSTGYVIYAFYLYVFPFIYFIYLRYFSKVSKLKLSIKI